MYPSSSAVSSYIIRCLSSKDLRFCYSLKPTFCDRTMRCSFSASFILFVYVPLFAKCALSSVLIFFSETRDIKLTACAVTSTVIELFTALMVQVRVPGSLRDTVNVEIEPLFSVLDEFRYVQRDFRCVRPSKSFRRCNPEPIN